MSLEITVSDLKNHQICEFGQLWRLLEREQCKIGSLLWRYKLFKISFLTTSILIETLYNQIWNICVRFVKSLNYLNLENFVTTGWRTHPGSLIMEINVDQNVIYYNFHFPSCTIKSNRTIFFNLVNELKKIIFNSMAILPDFQMIHHP